MQYIAVYRIKKKIKIKLCQDSYEARNLIVNAKVKQEDYTIWVVRDDLNLVRAQATELDVEQRLRPWNIL